MFSKLRTRMAIWLAALLLASNAFAASHREAPLIALDPAADITDFYAFRSWEEGKEDKVVLIMNVIPMQDPTAGPNYFNFDDDVLYEIHIDNNQNNTAQNIVYQFRFKTEIRPPGDFFPLSYVAVPPITALDGPDSAGLLLRQSYTVTEERSGHKPRNLGQGVMYAVPSNVGTRTMPNYEALAAKGIFNLKNGGRVFAGQRDETFYIDLGGTFDTLNLHVSPILSVADDANDAANVAGAPDSFSGFNINTIAIEVPIEEVIGDDEDGEDSDDSVIGAYASTSRPKVTVLRKNNKRDTSDRFVQVARMGNPLVNEVIIATKDKDRWNATDAEDEKKFLDFYCNSSLATALNLVFGTSFPTTDREDLVNALLRYNPGDPVCEDNGEHERFAELLRLDLSIDPTPPADQKRLGPLATPADPAGWPNGRRPNDDVVDVALRVVSASALRLGDGVNFNIGAEGSSITGNGIATKFPFLPTPHSGRP